MLTAAAAEKLQPVVPAAALKVNLFCCIHPAGLAPCTYLFLSVLMHTGMILSESSRQLVFLQGLAKSSWLGNRNSRHADLCLHAHTLLKYTWVAVHCIDYGP